MRRTAEASGGSVARLRRGSNYAYSQDRFGNYAYLEIGTLFMMEGISAGAWFESSRRADGCEDLGQ
jgi:hypothetical protein